MLQKMQFMVVGEGKDFFEARERLKSGVPPAVAMCLAAGHHDIEAALGQLRQARADYPAIKVIVVADHITDSAVVGALRSGVEAFVSSDISATMLVHVLELVLHGQRLFPDVPTHLLVPHDQNGAEAAEGPLEPLSPIPLSRRRNAPAADVVPLRASQVPPVLGPTKHELTRAGTSRALDLSEREREILHCLVSGHPNKVIARQLGIAETTVKVHVKVVLRKVRALNRTQAAIWALNNNFG
jgi:two-component system nitrate/nitrite response regulator NarL